MGVESGHENSAVKADSGLACLITMAKFHGVSADTAQLMHEFGMGHEFDSPTILLSSRSLSMTAKSIQQDINRLELAPLPAIAQDKEGDYFILAKCDVRHRAEGKNDVVEKASAGNIKVLIQRPGSKVEILSIEQLVDCWSGSLIFFTSKASFSQSIARFDFTWFIPTVGKYRKMLQEILVISFTLQMVALITPMFSKS